MDSREYRSDEPPAGTPAGGLSLKNLAFAIIIVQILLALLTYPFLPAMVPSHWNIAGQIDSYMPKFWNAVFMPGLSILMFLVLRVLISSPRLGSVESQRALKKYGERFLIVMLLFCLLMQGTITAFALGYKVDVVSVIIMAVGLLLIALGNSMGKLRRNFWIGIRTPWTLANEQVWERTHRLGGWLFVLAGIVMIALNLFAPVQKAVLILPILLVALITTIYSYVIYRKLNGNEGEPFSPPLHAE